MPCKLYTNTSLVSSFVQHCDWFVYCLLVINEDSTFLQDSGFQMLLVVFRRSLSHLLSGFPSSSEPPPLPLIVPDACSSILTFLVLLPLIVVFLPRVRSKTCFHLRAAHFQLFLLLFFFSGSNNFVPFLILCNNYGSAMLQIFSSPRLYFVFFARLSLIIHRQRMENFTAICSC